MGLHLVTQFQVIRRNERIKYIEHPIRFENNTWSKISIFILTPPKSFLMSLYPIDLIGEGEIWFDDVSLNEIKF